MCGYLQDTVCVVQLQNSLIESDRTSFINDCGIKYIRYNIKSLGTILDEHIKTKEALDIKDIFARLTTDTIGSCAFGLDCNSLKDPDTEFRRYGKKVFSFNFKDAILNILANDWPFILKLFKIPLTSQDVTDFFMNALKQTVDYREKNKVHRRDFLDLLIRLKNNQSVLDDLTESNVEGSGVLCCCTQCLELPAYMNRCSRSSPTIDQCIVESSNKIIPRLVVEGLDSFDIPKMSPLKLQEVLIRHDQALRFVLRNVEVYGLENTRMTHSKLDFSEYLCMYTLINPQINIVGDYEMDGIIAESYVTGRGRSNITLINGKYFHNIKFDIDDKEFARNISVRQFYTTAYNTYYFSGLVVGYESNEFRTNAFMNYHWKEVSRNFQTGATTYFEQCSRSSPTLNDCVVKSANKVIPRLVYGNEPYNIPHMLPLKLRKIIIKNNHDLHFSLRNVEVYGIERTKMIDANVDLLSNRANTHFYNPRIIVLGDYVINGKIINVPISGNGKANITLINGHYSQTVSFVINEELYIKFVSSHLSYRTERNIYEFKNLYNEIDFLGYQTNVFLNNNWKEVSQSFQPEAADAINQFIVSIYKNICDIVPINEIFTP
ncbi:Cytochrome P450 6a21 [Carabus blaptoides fortunei]